MSLENRNFRKLLLKEEKTQNDHYLLAIKFLLFSEENDDPDFFDIEQAMKHFEEVTLSESALTPLGYYGMAVCVHYKDPDDKIIPVLVNEGIDRNKDEERVGKLKEEIDMLYLRKIILESLEKQEMLGYFEELNKNLTLGYRMAGHAYLDTREEIDIDSEEFLDEWEKRDYDILKKAQENFYEAFKRGDLESFQPLYDCTLELKDWSTMFEILEQHMKNDNIKVPELLRKCTVLSKDFERGISLLLKGCELSYRYRDPLQKVKSYMEMRKKFPSSVTGVKIEDLPEELRKRFEEFPFDIIQTEEDRESSQTIHPEVVKDIAGTLPDQNPLVDPVD